MGGGVELANTTCVSVSFGRQVLPFLCVLVSLLDVDGDEAAAEPAVANTLFLLSQVVLGGSVSTALALFGDVVDQLVSALVLLSIRKVEPVPLAGPPCAGLVCWGDV